MTKLGEMVNELTTAGYEVDIEHHRKPYDKDHTIKKEDRHPEPKGGHTLAEIYNPECQEAVRAIAVCSDEDNYNKQIGGLIALGRARKIAGV